MTTDNSRTDFEAWAEARGYYAIRDDFARRATLHHAYLAWQAATSLARNEGLESAARVAEDPNNLDWRGGSTGSAGDTAKRIAALIRALKDEAK